MPYKDREDYNRYMRAYRAKKRANWQTDTEEPKEEYSDYPELSGYVEAFSEPKPIINERIFNPRRGYKGHADNPEAYGMKGTLCCSICGNALNNKGEGPLCNPQPDY